MSWADRHIERLEAGETVSFRPKGNSMTPLIKSGDLCTVSPVADRQLQRRDIVLCKVAGNQYLHLISAIRGDEIQISNNHGRVNGWTSRDKIYGVLDRVEP